LSLIPPPLLNFTYLVISEQYRDGCVGPNRRTPGTNWSVLSVVRLLFFWFSSSFLHVPRPTNLFGPSRSAKARLLTCFMAPFRLPRRPFPTSLLNLPFPCPPAASFFFFLVYRHAGSPHASPCLKGCCTGCPVAPIVKSC